MNVLVLSGENHNFHKSAPVIRDFLAAAGIEARVAEDRASLKNLRGVDAVVYGTGFTRTERRPDGTTARVPYLDRREEDALFDYVNGGGGLAGIHGTAWWIPSRAVALIGGHANWHPPGLTFTVHVSNANHPITQGVTDFEVEDEIYMSAWDPGVDVLATADWAEKKHPMAWTQPFGRGRVFYTTLGHGPGTFERPMMQKLVANGVRWAGGAAA